MADDKLMPTIEIPAVCSFEDLLKNRRAEVEAAIATRIVDRRWFGGKSRQITAVTIVDSIDLNHPAPPTPPVGSKSIWNRRPYDVTQFLWEVEGPYELSIVIVRITFDAGPDEVYQIPLGIMSGKGEVVRIYGGVDDKWADIHIPGNPCARALVDGTYISAHRMPLLLRLFDTAKSHPNLGRQIQFIQTDKYSELRGDDPTLRVELGPAEQSNTSIKYENKLILKLFRRLQAGVNPDLEMTRHLEKQGFAYIPKLAGSIEYYNTNGETFDLGILQQYVRSNSAWDEFLRSASFFDEPSSTLHMLTAETLVRSQEKFLSLVRKLGTRTAEMHAALASGMDDPAFIPQPLTSEYLYDFAQRARNYANDTWNLLRARLSTLPPDVELIARRVLDRQSLMESTWEQLVNCRDKCLRIRCHGDYHLGQVLVTSESGDDFVIIDFEGEPTRSIAERTQQQPAMIDVAGMLRSFHYLGYTIAENRFKYDSQSDCRQLDRAELERTARRTFFWAGAAFLQGYREACSQLSTQIVPEDQYDFQCLLDICLLNKAVYELRYELNNRLDWLAIPLAALDSFFACQLHDQD